MGACIPRSGCLPRTLEYTDCQVYYSFGIIINIITFIIIGDLSFGLPNLPKLKGQSLLNETQDVQGV